jgi:hypothetical protein
MAMGTVFPFTIIVSDPAGNSFVQVTHPHLPPFLPLLCSALRRAADARDTFIAKKRNTTHVVYLLACFAMLFLMYFCRICAPRKWTLSSSRLFSIAPESKTLRLVGLFCLQVFSVFFCGLRLYVIYYYVCVCRDLL